jgi:bifunctional non-homologous end joining protein LigD
MPPVPCPGRRRRRSAREEWLLVHRRDDAAVPGSAAEDYPASVNSGRTNDDLHAAADG